MSKTTDTLTQAETRRLAKFCGFKGVFSSGDKCCHSLDITGLMIFAPLANCADIERVWRALDVALEGNFSLYPDDHDTGLVIARRAGSGHPEIGYPTSALAVCRLALAVINERAGEKKRK